MMPVGSSKGRLMDNVYFCQVRTPIKVVYWLILLGEVGTAPLTGFPQKPENRIKWLFHDWFASFHDSHSHMVSDMVMIVSHNMHDNHKLESCHSHENKQFHDFSMAFWEIFIFQDFSMTFHDSNFFQDFPWLWEPCLSYAWARYRPTDLRHRTGMDWPSCRPSMMYSISSWNSWVSPYSCTWCASFTLRTTVYNWKGDGENNNPSVWLKQGGQTTVYDWNRCQHATLVRWYNWNRSTDTDPSL